MPETLPADRDREAVIDRLRRAYEHGRLDVAELEARIGETWASHSQTALAALTADLPAEHELRSGTPARDRREEDGHLAAFVVAMTVMVGIWLATGAGHPWPLWVFLGWGPAVLGHRLGLKPGPWPSHGRCGHRAWPGPPR